MASVGYNTVRYNELGKSGFFNPKLDVNAASQLVGYPTGLIDALQTLCCVRASWYTGRYGDMYRLNQQGP